MSDADVCVDPFGDAAWAQGQYRIDYDKCRRIEREGIPTVWPSLPTWRARAETDDADRLWP